MKHLIKIIKIITVCSLLATFIYFVTRIQTVHKDLRKNPTRLNAPISFHAVDSQQFISTESMFSGMCPTLAKRPPAYSCQGPALGRLHPVRSKSKSDCGAKKWIDLGSAVRSAAPHVYHLLDDRHHLLPMCTSSVAADVIDHGYISFISRTLTARHVRRGFVLDVGASTGKTTLVASVLGYQVIAFEASKVLAELLSRTVLMNGVESLVSVFQNGVADGVYTGTLAAAQDDTALPLVTIVCLDSLVPYLNVLDLPKVVTLLKIDVANLEPLVLRGATTFFAVYDVRTIFLEMKGDHWLELGCPPSAVATTLFKMDYVMSSHDGSLVSNKHEFERWYKKNKKKRSASIVFQKES